MYITGLLTKSIRLQDIHIHPILFVYEVEIVKLKGFR